MPPSPPQDIFALLGGGEATDNAASLHAFRTCLSRAEGDGIDSATFVAVSEELGLLGARLLPSEAAQINAASPHRPRSHSSAPALTPARGRKGKAAAERTADPKALEALELQWREQRKTQLSLQLLGLTWQQNASKIQARPCTRGCNPTQPEAAPPRTRGCHPPRTRGFTPTQ